MDEPEGGTSYLSADDMRQWAEREIKAVARALELRVKEIHGVVDAYAAGEITAEKADELKARYHHRWSEPLAGYNASESVTDWQILAALDQVRRPIMAPSAPRLRA